MIKIIEILKLFNNVNTGCFPHCTSFDTSKFNVMQIVYCQAAKRVRLRPSGIDGVIEEKSLRSLRRTMKISKIIRFYVFVQMFLHCWLKYASSCVEKLKIFNKSVICLYRIADNLKNCKFFCNANQLRRSYERHTKKIILYLHPFLYHLINTP